MSKVIVDIVNFNADASCLSSQKWLNDLKGGINSYFYNWLLLYIKNKKKISLGLIGATIADIKYYNPEAIDLINENQDIFEIILRPWSHDIGIYRNNDTFVFNVQMGINIIEKEFKNIARFFLSPEFMINSKQIELLKQFYIKAIFINPNRYDTQTAARIPKTPYKILGTSNSIMNCISMEGGSTKAFLKTMQLYDKNMWNNTILDYKHETIYTWRDGESCFLLPSGIAREQFWLKNEDENIQRVFLNDIDINYVENKDLNEIYYKSYPIHSFLAWMQEMKMMWYIDKISRIEKEFKNFSNEKKIFFLHLINSDILASVEKKSPEIDMIINDKLEEFTIYRQEKGFEGEEYLSIFNTSDINDNYIFMKKFKARNSYLKKILQNEDK